ncbi:MAG: riboflavin synthase [Acidobacteria bacterium]|nr:riboflavin synthase [Acidobacteriota bacterium]
MFTGLIESVGRLAEVKTTPTGLRLRVVTPLASELRAGESLAVNGVCLTVVTVGDGGAQADVSPETVRATTLGDLEPGTLVNLERPLRADARLGGHFVQGHVDATGRLEEIRPQGDFYWMAVSFPSLLSPYIVRKGSIAVDGISLTIAGLGPKQFDVQIVPFTWEHTNLHALGPHDRVNIECDILGKYVVRVAELSGLAIRGGLRAATH